MLFGQDETDEGQSLKVISLKYLTVIYMLFILQTLKL